MSLDVDFSEALRAIERIQKKASKGMVDNALEKGAEPILKAQQETVPVFNGYKKPKRKGGKLKSSLGLGKKTGSGSNRTIHVGIQNAQEEEVVYGYYQEHGTGRRTGKKWMKRAWNKSKSQANEEIKKSIVRDLKGK